MHRISPALHLGFGNAHRLASAVQGSPPCFHDARAYGAVLLSAPALNLWKWCPDAFRRFQPCFLQRRESASIGSPFRHGLNPYQRHKKPAGEVEHSFRRVFARCSAPQGLAFLAGSTPT